MLDIVLGLPLHPLVVHAVVVLLPLVGLGVVALAVVPRWRPRFALALLGLLIMGAGSAVLAMLSGNALTGRVGLPATHQTLGTALAYSAVGYLLLAGGWLWWVRKDAGDEPASRAKGVAGWVAAGLSLAIIGLTLFVGHSGANAVWSGVGAPPATPATPTTPVAPTTPVPSAAASQPSTATPPATSTAAPEEGYTMGMVAEHATAESCWVAINGFAYDVTAWIPQHPGGPERIIPLCGTDASLQFGDEHEDDDLPHQWLRQFLLGPLA